MPSDKKRKRSTEETATTTTDTTPTANEANANTNGVEAAESFIALPNVKVGKLELKARHKPTPHQFQNNQRGRTSKHKNKDSPKDILGVEPAAGTANGDGAGDVEGEEPPQKKAKRGDKYAREKMKREANRKKREANGMLGDESKKMRKKLAKKEKREAEKQKRREEHEARTLAKRKEREEAGEKGEEADDAPLFYVDTEPRNTAEKETDKTIEAMNGDGETTKSKKEKKKDKKNKKEKGKADKAEVSADEDIEVENGVDEQTEQPQEKAEEREKSDKKTKKEKKEKKEKKKKEKREKTADSQPDDAVVDDEEAENSIPGEQANGDENATQNRQQKHGRFIVFIGNLPYTANHESVAAHFQKIEPVQVRVATEKSNPSKCRGFAFIEFEKFDRMQTCLKLYHHSSFDDGKSPARRINVELTAGGGGKSQSRKEKLKEKNKKLAQERDKIAQEQKKDKSKKSAQSGDEPQANGTNETNGEAQNDYTAVHPSRLGLMGGGGQWGRRR